MKFRSILFRSNHDAAQATETRTAAFYRDLNLDQIIAALTAGKAEYDLAPFFQQPLRRVDDIAFRQEVFHDLEDRGLLDALGAFASTCQEMRTYLARAEKTRVDLQKQRWILDAAALYCEAVHHLHEFLSSSGIRSRGLCGFREFLKTYVASDRFVALNERTQSIEKALTAIRYCILIDGLDIEIFDYDEQADYGAEVATTFEKFRQSEVAPYDFDFEDYLEMNSVEARILTALAKLYSGPFAELRDFCADNADFVDSTIATFDREAQFYVAYLDLMEGLQASGAHFCCPRISDTSKEIEARKCFDLALALKLVGEKSVPICNDFALAGRERIIVVSGPNQGGKTTFARMVGQMSYFGNLGCPVPGTEARLFLFDRIFTHFEREEHGANQHGKLEDDLIRVHEILERATPASLVIMNEIFTSTTFRDALLLSKKVMRRLIDLDLVGIWVTFIDELASLAPQTVSMVSTVEPEDPTQRTYKVVRRAADGLAHALSIAQKHRVTYDAIRERLTS